eukprot:Skav211093  [mRNA]  locus=scaffold2002:336199:336528:- [translate_table: standard]
MAFDSYESWCAIRPDEIRLARHVLMTMSALIHRRHELYWHRFPWLLVALADPLTTPEFKASVSRDWDRAGPCCVRPGLARNLKQLNVNSQSLQDPTLGHSRSIFVSIFS